MHGGYSDYIVVDDRFVVSIPEQLDLAAAAPLLCAGITTYSPLMHFGLKPSDKLAVVGLGGLGHMGVKVREIIVCSSPDGRLVWSGFRG